MAPTLSEDEIDDLLYLARVGEKDDFVALQTELCTREKSTIADLLETARDEFSGNGALHMAAANGHDELLNVLLRELSKTGPQNPAMLAILNAQNKSGNTALHWAAMNGHLETVKRLLEHGADPTITNQRGHDAIFEAEMNDKTDVVEWVLKEGGEGLEAGFGGGDEEEGEAADEAMDAVEEAQHPNPENDSKLADTINQMDIRDGSPSVQT